MKTILAAIDFSPVTAHVVAEAAHLAATFGGRVVLLHSVPPPPIVATDLAPLTGPALHFTDDVRRAAGRHLRRIAAALEKRTIAAETFCTNGFPVMQILAHAAKLSADYIVIGSHGHSAFYDLVAGSTTSGVLKHADCPVVVVPARAAGATRPPRARASGTLWRRRGSANRGRAGGRLLRSPP